MHPIIAEFLTEKQYNHICRYWKIYNDLTEKINSFNYDELKWDYDEAYDSDYFVEECLKENKKIQEEYKRLINQRKFYDIEYAKYVTKIGLCLYNNDHPTILFNFLNVGSID